MDQATLAGTIAYDRTTITGVVDRLAQKGLVARNPSPRDRRAHQLSITKAGEKTLQQIEPAVQAAQQAMMAGLTVAEAKELMRLMRKAIDAGNELSRAPMREMAGADAKKA
jgi:DNA-binding MarR family transcriptional regulator